MGANVSRLILCAGCRKPCAPVLLCPADSRYWHRACLETRVSLAVQDALGSERFDSPTPADVAAFDAAYAVAARGAGL